MKKHTFDNGEKVFYCTYWPVDKRVYLTFDDFAMMIPRGWKELLRDLCEKLFYLGWDGGYAQIKEKFGTLRFYWRNNIKDEMRAEIAEDVVSYAEYRSGHVCDTCGENGWLRNDLGWVLTLCEKHYQEVLEGKK